MQSHQTIPFLTILLEKYVADLSDSFWPKNNLVNWYETDRVWSCDIRCNSYIQLRFIDCIQHFLIIGCLLHNIGFPLQASPQMIYSETSFFTYLLTLWAVVVFVMAWLAWYFLTNWNLITWQHIAASHTELTTCNLMSIWKNISLTN